MYEITEPSVWSGIMNMDRTAWKKVKDEKILDNVRSTAERYSENLPRETFYGLYNSMANIQEIPPEGLEIEHSLLSRAKELPEFQELRDQINEDELAALLGVSEFTTNLISKLPEDVKNKMEENLEAQNRLQNLLSQLSSQADENGNTPRSSPTLQKNIADAQSRVQQTKQNAMESLRNNTNQVQNSLAKAMRQTSKDMQSAHENLSALGFGDQKGKMTLADLNNLQELTRLLNGNKRLKKVIELIGAMKLVVSSEMKRSVYGREQLVEYERHELDLETLAPEEWVGIASVPGSPMKIDFVSRLTDNDILHGKYEGDAPMGKGPMIILKDTSGSMYGDRLEMANALDIAIMQQMLKEERRFVSIPFSSHDEWAVFEPGPRPDLQELINHMNLNYCGGTDPYPPLIKALDIILERQDFKRAGILIITDGEFDVPPEEFFNKLEQVRDNPGVKIVSLVIGSDGGSVDTFADKIVPIEDIFYTDKDETINKSLGEALSGML